MRVLIVAVLVVGAAACSHGPSTEPRTEALLHVSIVANVIPGSVHLAGHYDMSTGPDGVINCSTAASDGNTSLRTFVIGGPATRRMPLYFSIRTRGFSGPGVYRDRALDLVSVNAFPTHEPLLFARAVGSSVVMTLHDDGSGSASFSGYRAPQGATISARLRWTCTTKTVRWPKEST